MTQTQPDRLDRLEVSVERITDAITSIHKKLDVFQAKTDEQIKGLSSQILDLKTDVTDIRTQLRSQDTRLWGFVTALVLALVGLLEKLAFFPQA